MKIDLLPLINNIISVIKINENVEISKENLKGTELRNVKELKVEGSIDDLGDNIFNLKLLVTGKMVLPCALSLEDVIHPFEFIIDQNVGYDEEFEENYKIVGNTLDIFPILWENIVLEIPSRVVKDNVKIKTEGDGWSLTNEDNFINNQLSDLKVLLDREEKK